LALDRILCSQLGLRIVKSHEVGGPRVAKVLDFIQVDATALAAVLLSLFASGTLDQNATHRFGGSGEEMSPAVPTHFFNFGPLRRARLGTFHEPEIGFMNERGGLKRLTRAFLCQFCRR
jgi:hypothetical protein